MRWEDERYVRVYTRDTGDWLALSFEAQALFLMLLRKLDRIGELHLGKRGLATVAALVGHPGRASIGEALKELLADGCVRLTDDETRLFVPNFLKAQEVAKSPAERKREQRERDAAQALEKTELSRDVTQVTFGHEMSPRAVPNHAVPSVPNHAEPEVTQPVEVTITNTSVKGYVPVTDNLPRTVAAPTTEPETWTGREFWCWAQSLRVEGGFLPEREPANLSSWWSACRMTPGVTAKAMQLGFTRFGQTKHWEGTDPPYPFRAFMKGWSDYTQPEVRHGSAA